MAFVSPLPTGERLHALTRLKLVAGSTVQKRQRQQQQEGRHQYRLRPDAETSGCHG
jgi:hypothetical protein